MSLSSSFSNNKLVSFCSIGVVVYSLNDSRDTFIVARSNFFQIFFNATKKAVNLG